MGKITFAEILIYIVFYCFGLLAVPYIAGIASMILLSPAYILLVIFNNSLFDSQLMSSLSLVTRLLTFAGVFIFYYLITKENIYNYGKINKFLFVFFFIVSLALNYFITYIVCAISMLVSCDTKEIMNISNLWRVYIFYAITLVAVAAAISKQSRKLKTALKE